MAIDLAYYLIKNTKSHIELILTDANTVNIHASIFSIPQHPKILSY
jgi:hypothetical protein